MYQRHDMFSVVKGGYGPCGQEQCCHNAIPSYDRIEWYDGRMNDVMWCQIMMPQLLRNLTNTSPELSRSRALTSCCSGSILSISPFVLPQLSGPWQQPASAAACRRVLEPDILEVSHLCGCMYRECLSTLYCLMWCQMIIFYRP